MSSACLPLFMKQDLNINDSNDLSCVNDYTDISSKEIIIEITQGSIVKILPSLSLFIINTINIIFLSYGKSNMAQDIRSNEYLITFFLLYTVFIYFFGFNFMLGGLKYLDFFFKNDELKKAKKGFKSKSAYLFFRNLIVFNMFTIIIPLAVFSYPIINCFYFDSISEFYLWKLYKCYIIFIPCTFYFMMHVQLNFQVLQNFNKNKLVFSLFCEYILLHFFICLSLFFFFNPNITTFPNSILESNSTNPIIYEYTQSLNNTNNNNNNYYSSNFSDSDNTANSNMNNIEIDNYNCLLTTLALGSFFANFISSIISHYLIINNILTLNKIRLNIFNYFSKLQFENFELLLKEAAKKAILFNFSYLGICIIALSAYFIDKTYALPTLLAFSILIYPHTFSLGISKYYRNHLELTVFSYSHNSKRRYLKIFALINIMVYITFLLVLAFLKLNFFEFIFPQKFNYHPNLNEIGNNNHIHSYDYIIDDGNLNKENKIFKHLIDYYLIFMVFDFISNAFEAIIKVLDDNCKKFLTFLKGTLLILLFIPLGMVITLLFGINFFWGYWIGLYLLLIFFPLALFLYFKRNYKNSIFQF